MSDDLPRDLGEQSIARVMDERGVTAHDVVAASTEQITHKMVQRARKGRRLTPQVMKKIQRALNAATGESFALRDLFDYGPD
jgi:flagellar motor switch protein FliG